MYFIFIIGEIVFDVVVGGVVVFCLGNGNFEVIEIMYEQVKKMVYIYYQSLDVEGSEKFVKWLCDRSEGVLVVGVFLNFGKWYYYI